MSDELRRLLLYALSLEVERVRCSGGDKYYFEGDWERVAKDFHVLFLKKDSSTFENSPYDLSGLLRVIAAGANIGKLFNFVEFFTRHPKCSAELKSDLAGAFEKARAAYRIMDSLVVGVGTGEQAAAFERAVAEAGASNAGAARAHLVAAGAALRNADWAESVRESIHAVESMAG